MTVDQAVATLDAARVEMEQAATAWAEVQDLRAKIAAALAVVDTYPFHRNHDDHHPAERMADCPACVRDMITAALS